jgi:hypothetical protein
VSLCYQRSHRYVNHVSIAETAVSSQQQSAHSGPRSDARNRETALAISSAITCYVRVGLIDVLISFVPTKGKK